LHAIARRPQADLDFRTYGDPFHLPPQGIGQQGIPLMPAVVADMVAQQALADADAKAERSVHDWRLPKPLRHVKTRTGVPVDIREEPR
jgi:hypothetical protein